MNIIIGVMQKLNSWSCSRLELVMPTVSLPLPDDFDAWRDAARACRVAEREVQPAVELHHRADLLRHGQRDGDLPGIARHGREAVLVGGAEDAQLAIGCGLEDHRAIRNHLEALDHRTNLKRDCGW